MTHVRFNSSSRQACQRVHDGTAAAGDAQQVVAAGAAEAAAVTCFRLFPSPSLIAGSRHLADGGYIAP